MNVLVAAGLSPGIARLKPAVSHKIVAGGVPPGVGVGEGVGVGVGVGVWLITEKLIVIGVPTVPEPFDLEYGVLLSV